MNDPGAGRELAADVTLAFRRFAVVHESDSVFRYEVNFQSGIDCGGAYVKLLSQTPDLDLVSLHVI